MAMAIDEQEPVRERTPYRERAAKRERGTIERLKINGRDAVNIHGANEILDTRAKDEMGEERRYYESRPYAMYRAGRIEGVEVSRRIFYYVDSLKKVELPRHYHQHGGGVYKKPYAHSYPEHIKARALTLFREGNLSQRGIAEQIATEFSLPDFPYQAVHYWVKEARSQQAKTRKRRTPTKRKRA